MSKSKDSNQIQMSKPKKFYFWLVLFMLHATCFLLHVPAVQAQQASITVGPSVSYIAIQPGKSVSPPFIIENKGDPGVLKLKVRPFRVSDSAGHIEIKEAENIPIKFSLEQDNLNF